MALKWKKQNIIFTRSLESKKKEGKGSSHHAFIVAGPCQEGEEEEEKKEEEGSRPHLANIRHTPQIRQTHRQTEPLLLTLARPHLHPLPTLAPPPPSWTLQVSTINEMSRILN